MNHCCRITIALLIATSALTAAINIPSNAPKAQARPFMAVPPPVTDQTAQPNPSNRPKETPTGEATARPLRLQLGLTDGSVILGEPSTNRLPIKTELGNIVVDLDSITSAQFSERDGKASIKFRNGDNLTGIIAAGEFELKTIFGIVRIPLKLVRQLHVIPASSKIGGLLNVNFGWGNKKGRAATGETDEDFWNVCNSARLQNAFFANLKMADGNPTEIGLSLDNAAGAWGNKSGDTMYDSYVYPNGPLGDGVGAVTVTITNLPAGLYDFYLYGHADAGGRQESNSRFTIQTGAQQLGPLGTTRSSGWKATEPWVEGVQYVLFRRVEVIPDKPVVIIVAPGFDGKPDASGVAVINGLQIVPAK